MRDYYMGLIPLNTGGSINWAAVVGILLCLFSGYLVVMLIEGLIRWVTGS